jgi:RNA polymerase sigma factor (sigma-70 family)
MLIKRIANGDQLAMRTLFARHQTRVYRFVLRLLKNEAAAEDVVSEVFFDVWRQAGQFEARASVSTWLLSIARFKALTAMRRRPNLELDDDMMSCPPFPADIGKARAAPGAHRLIRHDRVDQALDRARGLMRGNILGIGLDPFAIAR